MRSWSKIILTAAMLLSLTGVSYADGEAPGTKIGDVYATDIVTCLDGVPIPSVNIGGKMAVVVEDLADYGFSVRWDPESGILYADSVERPEHPPVYTPAASGTSGQVIGSIYATDVSVYMNGLPLPAFNLGGRMAVTLRDLCEDNTDNFWRTNPNRHIGYSNWGFRLEWDPDTSTSNLYALHIGDRLEVDGREYPVVEFLTSFQEGSANPTIYQDGEMLDLGVFGSRRDHYMDEESFRTVLEDYSWSFAEGMIQLRFPDTIPDYFFTELDGAQQTQYPNRRGFAPGTYKSCYGAAIPVVSVPVVVEQNGSTKEYQVDACVFASSNRSDSWFSFDRDLFEIVGLPVIPTP